MIYLKNVHPINKAFQALDEVMLKKNYRNIFVSGGSHGGFLTAHLSAARPEIFKAAAIRNPVCR